jgi:hypothetical protein
LVAIALFGFGLLLFEFELFLVKADFHEVGERVYEWKVQLGLFMQA